MTRAATRRSVTEAVFLTTELLENILRHLPMKDLLLVQRVCRKWRAVITSNKELQQALYFIPIEPTFRWKDERPPVRKLTRVPSDTPISEDPPFSIFESGSFNPLIFREYRSPDTILGIAHEGHDLFKFIKQPSMKYPEE